MSAIEQTKAWLSSFIIHYSICPFAKQVFDNKSIYYTVFESEKMEHCLEKVYTECLSLDKNIDRATTLIIFPNQFKHFNDFLDFLAITESLIIEQGYEGIYQLASFHPLYCFEGESTDDPANYTNRSPYPMLHLLREADIEQVLQSFPNPDSIPQRNIQLTRKMGLQKMQALLKNTKTSK